MSARPDLPDERRDDGLASGGEMGGLIRAFDWSTTPLGPIERWPQALQTVVRIVLASRYAMWLGWGPELTFFYNDAYARMTLGPKHPWALGRSARAVWSEIWHDIGPRTESVLRTGIATWDEGLLLFLERSGFPEETYHTFSYSPVPDDRGGIGGMLCVVTEDTERTIGERRLKSLRELAAATASARTAEDACERAARSLASNPHDLPFVLVYLVEGGGKMARLAAQTGVEPGSAAAPEVLPIPDPDGRPSWPLAAVLAAHQPERVTDLGRRFGPVEHALWPEPVGAAVVLPLAQAGQDERLTGFFVAGLSPRRPYDESYAGFLKLLAGQVASAIADARAYEEEKRRAEALAELDRAKTAFFSNVSHEFRTPLTLLLGPVEDALHDAREPWQRDRLEMIHRNGLRLQKLVNTLLDFSRIEAGRVQASYEPTDLAAFTAELASNFRSACAKAGLGFTVDCPPLPEPVYVDRDMWEKVVLNLLSNAFKFTLEGEIAVALTPDGDAAKLTVRDTGTGISDEQLPHVFERFHRVEGVRARTHEGTGIGLALVQELVRLHGGAVAVASAPRRGTTFTVTVPFGTAHLPAERVGNSRTFAATGVGTNALVEEAHRWLPDATPAARSNGAATVTAGAGPRPRVLVVDDNADMRNYLRKLLAADYEVVAVSDGRQALTAAAEHHRPDLVLTDVMMPVLDGFGLLKALRADPQTATVPVVMLSARAGEEARVEGLHAGADDYLTKPFSARELLARVGGALALARTRREAAERERESEERFRTLADNMSQLAWMTDAAGWIFWYNRRWFDFTGTTLDEMQGWGWQKVHHPDHVGRVVEKISHCFQTGEPWEDLFPLRGRDGHYRWFLSRALPIRDAEGQVIRWFGTNTDVTEQRAAEEALKEADRRKDEFLATLAHELRNPLAPVRTGLQVLKLAPSAAAAEKAREMIDRQVAHMVRLIDDLLDVSRVSRGKVVLKKERADARAVIEAALEVSRPLIDAARHGLFVALPKDPLPLDADPTRLAQVVSNLLNNAAKYTPEGGRIELSAERDGGEAVIRVRDNGTGIPDDMLPKVFDLFTQVGHSLNRAQGGLGIGLSLVKKLVEMHDGSVAGESPGPGRGSTFTVRLPLAAEPEQPTTSADVAPAAPRSVPHRRVLVVDDNVDSAESLAMLLTFSGHETRTAHNGPDAVTATCQFHPDVVFLDIGLPGMNGYEVAERLRREPALNGTVLVALTGWGSEEDRQRSKEAGFDRHLTKPVDAAHVEALLAELGARLDRRGGRE